MLSSVWKAFSVGIVMASITVFAKDVVLDWDITYVTTNRGLTQSPKRGIGVNGKFPIPMVRASKGDTLVINAHNSLDVPTSLHSHGIFQNGTNYYDGVSMATGCAIAPGKSFTYQISLREQVGTYWIHGHTFEQNYEGLRTVFIIDDPDTPYPFDKEFVFAVEDWTQYTFKEAMGMILARNPYQLPINPPPLTLINGVSGNETKPMKFTPGETYLIRLVNMQSLSQFDFSIDEHELKIVEVDGVYTKPKDVASVRLFPAQRVSVLVRAKPHTDLNYTYRLTVTSDFIPPIAGAFPAMFSNLVEYAENATVCDTRAAEAEIFDELSLESFDNEPPMVPDRVIYMNLTYGTSAENRTYETINYITYKDPHVPSIFTAMTMGDLARNPIVYGPQVNAQVIKHMEVVEMLLWSSTFLPHPMHLHGHAFQVIERGRIEDLTGERRKMVSPTGSPLKRDTLCVNHGEYYVIRFRADNPGVWLFHCHIDWHLGQGLAMSFIEAPEVMQERLKIPDSVNDQCKNLGIKTRGNVVGNPTYNYDGAPIGPRLPYLDVDFGDRA